MATEQRPWGRRGWPSRASAGGPGEPRPTGNVTFAVDGTVAGTSELKPSVRNCSTARLALRHLTVGSHTITATYSGDADYASNSTTPETLVHTVNTCKHHGRAPKNGNPGC
ncbi:Ig-like domain-containing protein [Streptomyces sp. LX-29]|uniref:Ig-like domain-containing protein n=1 Tax=Streptomyces sp. LX-29 TaxID=2900152 RepID=UPI00240DF421|nr:Ig-like domain-containing protein [Streptomyces sp. LX-29]WFB05626.1 Ig-like domain-containing protein [Streptomyces sp. LX-29]